jgi:hypothetical protein
MYALARATHDGVALTTPGTRRRAAAVASTSAPAATVSSRAYGAKTSGPWTPAARWMAARRRRSTPFA